MLKKIINRYKQNKVVKTIIHDITVGFGVALSAVIAIAPQWIFSGKSFREVFHILGGVALSAFGLYFFNTLKKQFPNQAKEIGEVETRLSPFFNKFNKSDKNK